MRSGKVGCPGWYNPLPMRRGDLLDLNEILQHPGRKLEVDISTELEGESGIELMSPLEGYLAAYSTGNMLMLSGEFSTTVMLPCARCSEPIEVAVTLEVDEQFPVEGTPSSYSHNDFARVKPDEPYALFDGNSLMVEALLRQDLLVACPVQPLCQYGWDGDCPKAAGIQVKKAQEGRPEFQRLSNLMHSDEATSEEPS